MAEIATIEPSEITAGDTIQWKKTLSDYPASAGWALKYRFINSAAKYDITAAADGDDHLVTIAAATSAGYTAGTYTWTRRVEKGTERYTLGSGTVEILPDLAAKTTAFDNRSHAKTMLDAIEATLEGKATGSQLDILKKTIGDKNIDRNPELLKSWRNYYRAEYKDELRKERIKQGLRGGGQAKVRF